MQILIKFSKRKMKVSIVGAILLLLTTRIVVFPSGFLSIYGKLSQISFLLILIMTCYKIKNKQCKIDLKYLLQLILLYLIIFITTYINYGSIKLIFGQMYPIIGLFFLFTFWEEEELYNSIKSFGILLSVLVILNTILCVFNLNEELFGKNIYLLGIKNQIGISLIICNYILNLIQFKKKSTDRLVKTVILLCSTYTIIYIHSGNNILAWIVFLLYFVIGKMEWINKFTIIHTVGAYVFFLIGVVFFQVQKYFQWLIATVLKKDLTFSSRTIIWEKCLEKIKQKPFIGYGLQENSNIIELSGVSINGSYQSNMFSAHNTVLQLMYQNGILLFVPLMILIYYTSKKLSKVRNSNWKSISLFALIAVLLIMFAEAVQISTLLSLLIIISNLYKFETVRNGENK